MEDLIGTFFTTLLANESGTLLAFLFIAICYLLWEKKESRSVLIKQNDTINELNTNYNKSINDIIMQYHDGQINIVKALNEIKIVLTSMEQKIH
jgi:hypothetical protein